MEPTLSVLTAGERYLCLTLRTFNKSLLTLVLTCHLRAIHLVVCPTVGFRGESLLETDSERKQPHERTVA